MARLSPGAEQHEQKPMENGAEQDDSIALHTAAEELMRALESKSAAHVVDAFKSLMELCDSEEESQESPEEEQSEQESSQE
jgi:hypothetical protein